MGKENKAAYEAILAAIKAGAEEIASDEFTVASRSEELEHLARAFAYLNGKGELNTSR